MPILSGPFIDFFTRLHWDGMAFWDYGYEHWFKASNFWKVWVFIFLQCIVMPISFLEKAWRRFIKVNVFGNSAFFFFSKGSSLQLKDLWIDIEQETGWEAGMLHCDYSSHIFGYRIFFSYYINQATLQWAVQPFYHYRVHDQIATVKYLCRSRHSDYWYVSVFQ